jgi:hypothetical protein
MKVEITDEMLEQIGQLWNKLGYNPILVFRLLERGFTGAQINEGMTKLIGKDWSDQKAGVWIDRMIDGGSELMKQSLLFDKPPVIDVLEYELRKMFKPEMEE